MTAMKKSASVSRGDVVLAYSPFASGKGAKRRPCVAIQNDEDNARLQNTIIVQITSNLARVGDKSHALIEAATPAGRQSGLLHDSLVSCNNPATIELSLIDKVIGKLAPSSVQQVNDCLKAAFGLP